MKKAILIFLSLFLLTGCNFLQNENSDSTQSSSETILELPSPTDLKYLNNTLSWSYVENAVRYGVRINSREEIQTEDLAYVLGDDFFQVEQDFYFCVRSIGDGCSAPQKLDLF